VPILTLAQFAELTRIRLVVEGFAAEEAARHADAAALEEIAACEAAFHAAAEGEPADPAGAVAANHRFHFALYRASRMPRLVEMIERLWLIAGPVLNLDMRSASARLKGGSAVRCHAAIVAALRAGDAAAARAGLVEDISAAARHIESTGRLRADG